VETFRPISGEVQSLKLTLTGPRNYLLTSVGNRYEPGTKVSLLVRDSVDPETFSGFVRALYRRAEFPLVLRVFGDEQTLEAERPEEFAIEVEDVTSPHNRFVVRPFPFAETATFGEIYVLAYKSGQDPERWDRVEWARRDYPQRHPLARAVELPPDLYCVQGLSFHGEYRARRGFAARLDYRGEAQVPGGGWGGPRTFPKWQREAMGVVDATAKDAVAQHLASRPASDHEWNYRQRLASLFPFLDFWESYPATIRTLEHGEARVVSLKDLDSTSTISTAWVVGSRWLEYTAVPGENVAEVLASLSGTALDPADINRLSRLFRTTIFETRFLAEAHFVSDRCIVLKWRRGERPGCALIDAVKRPASLVDLQTPTLVGFPIHFTTDDTYAHAVLNSSSPFVRWLSSVAEACLSGAPGLNMALLGELASLLRTPLWYSGLELEKLTKFVDKWTEIKGLPTELYPPTGELKRKAFASPW
jgi:hypothetical protein